MVGDDLDPEPALVEQLEDQIDERDQFLLDVSGQAGAQLVPDLVDPARLDPGPDRTGPGRPGLLGVDHVESPGRHLVPESGGRGGIAARAEPRREVLGRRRSLQGVMHARRKGLRRRGHGWDWRKTMPDLDAHPAGLQAFPQHRGDVEPQAVGEDEALLPLRRYGCDERGDGAAALAHRLEMRCRLV
ncbi:MAG: hypothetical protein WCG78_07675, partial [Candidatus Omnitrophota bacterium]